MKHRVTAAALLLALYPVLLWAQSQPFRIEGELGTQNTPTKATLYYIDLAKELDKTDSVQITNGQFIFNGQVEMPTKAYLYVFDATKHLKQLLRAALILSSSLTSVRAHYALVTTTVSVHTPADEAAVKQTIADETLAFMSRNLPNVLDNPTTAPVNQITQNAEGKALGKSREVRVLEKQDNAWKFIHVYSRQINQYG